jgi:cyanophycinase-like exopeptidase
VGRPRGLTPAYAEALAAAAEDLDEVTVVNGIGLDEDTAWRVTDPGTEVLGGNAVHLLTNEGTTTTTWEVRLPSTVR